MNPKRMHTLFSSAAVATALSLSLASCASFDPNPAATGQGPVTPSGTQPAATGNNGATPAATALVGVAGKAESIQGEPLANARVYVFDAFTGARVAGIVSAGAGNYGLAQADGPKTDANGNYSFDMPAIGDGDLLRVVVIGEDRVPYESLLGNGSGASGYAVAQTGGKTTFQLSISLSSSLVSKAMNGTLNLLSLAAEKRRRAKALNDLRTKVNQLTVAIARAEGESDRAKAIELRAEYQAACKLTEREELLYTKIDSTYDGAPYREIEAAIKASGLDKATNTSIDQLVADALQAILDAAKSGELTLSGEFTLSNGDFPSTLNFDSSKIKEGIISYTNPTTGQKVVADVEVADKVTDPVTDPVIPDDIVVVDETDEGTDYDDFISESGKFIPSVVVQYDADDSTSPLKLKVSQTAGQLDVEKITAKIPMAYVSHLDLSASRTTLTDATTNQVTGAWETLGLTTGDGHAITGTGDGTTWNGTWEDGNGADIASVTVKKETGFVTITFTMASALATRNQAVTVKGGVVTLEALADVIELDHTELAKLAANSNNVVEIVILSRDGADTATASDNTTDDEVVNYTRSVELL